MPLLRHLHRIVDYFTYSPASVHNQLHLQWSSSHWLQTFRKCHRFPRSSRQHKTLAGADIHKCIVPSIERWKFWTASRSHTEQCCCIWKVKTVWNGLEWSPQRMLTKMNNLTEKTRQQTSLQCATPWCEFRLTRERSTRDFAVVIDHATVQSNQDSVKQSLAVDAACVACATRKARDTLRWFANALLLSL